MVFQDYAVFPHLSVRDNIAFGLRARRLPAAEIAPRVAEAVRLVRLEGMETRMPAALSGGQQQRVGIARALAIRPRLLLMDEPLSNLDAKLRVEMREDIRDIQRALGLTTIYVTHDQEEALAISDRVCVMNKGLIEQIGSPLDIYRRPVRRFPAAFVGTMNFLAATIDGDGMRFDGRSWRLDRDAPHGAVEIAIRPESILVDDNTGAAGITMHGSVRKTTFLGRETHCTIQTSAGEITAQFPEARPELLTDEARPITILLPFNRLAVFRPGGEALDVRVMA
jgi:ABC-type Fe3+/spermidine/putrescine transport system ATPase subunit